MTNALNREIPLPKIRLPRRHVFSAAFWLTLALGVLLRVWEFPGLPDGLNQDELSAGYEAWSLLQTGADRWGYHLPAYFLSWGSGQNVLYSYLDVPFIAMFGLTPLAIRMVALIFGLLMLPLVYVFLKRLYGRRAGLLGMLVVAVIPWAFMISRWGLESNLLPFFLLLGAYLLLVGLDEKSRTWQRVIALLPFAVGLYAYGIGIIPIGILLVLVLVFYFRQVVRHWVSWLVAVVLFLVAASPFLLFLVKNYVLHAPLGFEGVLPFTIPMLTETRLQQLQAAGGGSVSDLVFANLNLLANGFQTYDPWSSILGHPPIFQFLLVVAGIELLWRLFRFVFAVKAKQWRKPDMVTLWFVACLPLFGLIKLNLNQANAMHLPLIFLGVVGLIRFLAWLRWPRIRKVATALVVAVVLFQGVGAFQDYTGYGYSIWSAGNFNPGIQRAFKEAQQEAAGQPLYIDSGVLLNYVQTLWYLQIPSTEFQKYHPTTVSYDFENFKFNPVELKDAHGYYELLTPSYTSNNPCKTMRTIKMLPHGYIIGYCA